MNFRERILIESRRCRLLAVGIICMGLGFVGCAAPAPPKPAAEKEVPVEVPVEQAVKEPPQELEVKGLYLGMDIHEGGRILKEYMTPEFAKELGEGEPFEVTKIPPFEECNYGLGFFPFGCPKIFLMSDCSEDRKVYSIYIHNDIADKMFDAEGMSQEEFVQAFERAHNISMRPKLKWDSPGGSPSKSWEFESPYGYKVTINEGHTVLIEQVAEKKKGDSGREEKGATE